MRSASVPQRTAPEQAPSPGTPLTPPIVSQAEPARPATPCRAIPPVAPPAPCPTAAHSDLPDSVARASVASRRWAGTAAGLTAPSRKLHRCGVPPPASRSTSSVQPSSRCRLAEDGHPAQAPPGHLHRCERQLVARTHPDAGAIAARAGSPPPCPPAPAETAPYPIFHSRDRLPEEVARCRPGYQRQAPRSGRGRGQGLAHRVLLASGRPAYVHNEHRTMS